MNQAQGNEWDWLIRLVQANPLVALGAGAAIGLWLIGRLDDDDEGGKTDTGERTVLLRVIAEQASSNAKLLETIDDLTRRIEKLERELEGKTP